MNMGLPAPTMRSKHRRVSAAVLIVEDDTVTRLSLASGLAAAEITVAGACASGEEALELADEQDFDVVLIDLGLPGISGIETIRRLRAARPDLAALVLTVVESPEQIVAAFEAGATGYLLKDAAITEIARAVNQVRDGLAPISPQVARHIVATMRGREQAAPRESRRELLTPREQEILSLLVGGHAYAAIATALEIGLGTVQSHVKSIYRKLEVASKAEAVGVALTEGIVRRDPRR
jgi:DNA-binding NarL/FixJ family response regulator